MKSIDGYIIPKNDEFFGEHTSKVKDRLNYISNFSGSYGFSLILKDKNYLFVDGRYTLQARVQSGRNFKIMTFPKEMPNDILKRKNISIGFDPNLFTAVKLVDDTSPVVTTIPASASLIFEKPTRVLVIIRPSSVFENNSGIKILFWVNNKYYY